MKIQSLIWGRYSVLFYSICTSAITLYFSMVSVLPVWSVLIPFPISILAYSDYRQQLRPVLSNYPVLARFRYLFETFRPELRQYLFEGDDDKVPYSRNQRTMVYQRAKSIMAARPFGSTKDMYVEDYTWLNHSMQPCEIENDDFRVKVGAGAHSYEMSVLNISGTSFGALSPPAIQALSLGAKLGGFAHNTGEGSFSPYHQAGGGDTIWQISTAYFGCRTPDGKFDAKRFTELATLPQVKMLEIKLSQGAKPGHGGILLAPKVTPEIAATRGVTPYQDCVSPSKHSEFSTPHELLQFADRLRQLSGGKPVGMKFCLGHPWEFLSICKAMVETGLRVDFVTVDGAEGGTGAAPVEFTDHIGTPLRDALVFVDNALRGAGLRQEVKVAASGKIVSAYDLIHHFALGADWVNMARPFMFSIGCIQARDCASGRCPTGLATMDPDRYRVVDVPERANRVKNFHHNTLKALTEMLESAGLHHPSQLTRRHIVHRTMGATVKLEEHVYPHVNEGALVRGEPTDDIRLNLYWPKVSKDSFHL
jgi:glutamate synthase domain-containing protein 2